ncbi:hypothetical protein DM02DRAFT_709850 [Periconia macrospinosa]|uniref:Alcohol acetyltransferase n=1 Tax=Periconia macrospinosa TaxID=97972 RepID=A0A2V1DPN1_9PLEO|nr:hypothetical protein DM02DRAFT_709850 [Periconia macrospinosa]
MIRPLGYNELYQLARYTTDQYRGTSVLCRYEIPVNLRDKNELTNTINTAVKRVIASSPTLRSVISGADTSEPVWIQLHSLDLNEHIKWATFDDAVASDQAVRATVLEQLSMRFWDLDKRPGWRLVVMQHATKEVLDILFVWNHPHADGMSGKIFHEHLLEALNQLPANEPQHSGHLTMDFTDSSVAFPPRIEETVELTLTTPYLLKEAWKEYKPTSLFPSATDARWAPIQALQYKFSYESATVSETVLRKILHMCRDRGTTLTGLLNSLVLVSLASHLEAKIAPGFMSSTAIDQRRFVPAPSEKYPDLVPAKTIGNYVTVLYHEYDKVLLADIRGKIARSKPGCLSEDLLDSLWAVAKRVRGEISKRLEMGVHNDLLGLSKMVPDWSKKFKKDAKKPRPLSWFLTNLGVFEEGLEAETGNSWVRKRAQFTLSTETPLAALLIGVASVRGEDLVFTCTWQDTVVERILFESLMMDLVKWLNQIGGE